MKSESKLYQSITTLTLVTMLLIIPLLAMQFSDEVAWTLSDFIVAGGLLFGTGFLYILVTQILAKQMKENFYYRIAVGFALISGLFLIWSNLAVGIVGLENNPFNVLYFGVISVGIVGAIIARFQSQGMALTLFAMAITQALLAATALVGGFYQSPPSTVFHIIGVNGFFITLFVGGALLFRYAGRQQLPASSNPEEA